MCDEVLHHSRGIIELACFLHDVSDVHAVAVEHAVVNDGDIGGALVHAQASVPQDCPHTLSPARIGHTDLNALQKPPPERGRLLEQRVRT